MTTATRRPTRRAVSRDWKTASACLGTDTESFFSPRKAEQDIARRVCLGCPVIAECLAWHRRFDDPTYRWGIGGGLNDVQRRALEAEEKLGNVPNLDMSRVLVSQRWLPRLEQLHGACKSLDGIVRKLHDDGLMVDVVTVRVALWWVGYEGSRLRRVRKDDHRHPARRLRQDRGDELVALRKAGLTVVEVAAYLGAAFTHTKRALETLRAIEVAREHRLALEAGVERAMAATPEAVEAA